MNLTITATKNPDGTATVSWVTTIETKVHTIFIRVWFGKKKTSATKLHPVYKWAIDNPNNGEVELTGSRTIDLSLLDANWQQANFDGYVCQLDTVESDYDDYTCQNSNSVKVTKK